MGIVFSAQAERPTEGGLFSFDATDEVVYYEDGMVRVHYSVSGNNQTLLDDADGSGVPDFVFLGFGLGLE